MSNFINIEIRELDTTVTGKTPSSNFPEDFGNDYMFITPSDSFDNKIIDQTYRYLSDEGLTKLKNKALPPYSVLVSCIGSAMGKVTMNKSIAISNQQINSIIVDSKFDSHYIYYCLKNNYRLLRNAASGSTALPMLNKTDFDKLQIVIQQDKSTQQKIAKVLSDLDAKIELNNKINAELKAMAKTLYDYWFVQFDFPFDFAQGKPVPVTEPVEVPGLQQAQTPQKPYKSSGGKMVWNEKLKREIPEGWEVGTLLDIAVFTNGLACQKFRPKENEDYYRVIKIREMGSGFTENSEFVSTNIPEKVIVYNGDILFSWSATLDVKIWTGGTGGLNQHIFKVTSKKYPKSYYYFELLNYLQHFKMIAELRKTTMGHITQDHLKESRITIPPIELIQKLDKIISPILEKKVKLDQENQQLASLRDWLLPMLMNGQVTVASTGLATTTGSATDEQLGMVAEEKVEYKK